MNPLVILLTMGLIIYGLLANTKSEPVHRKDLIEEMEYQREDEEFEKSVIDLKNTESYKRYIVEESTK